ncbi:E3 ubiquitin-protein ligase RNF19B-like [Sardina pilchardus]|uniref:E3 ubiquitin-protein ligase RNF19B-like n=1 Tax=Sardina pilchardus TaxID=27697 RepID=UPI002E0D10CF
MASALPGNRLMTSDASKQTECPRCHKPDGRVVDGHRSVCKRCSRSLRRVYQFCWACRREWPRTGSLAQGRACTLPNCAVRAALLSEERISDPTSAANDCPFFRACPGCKELVTHSGEGCRYITCLSCATEFCFRCLREECCLEEEEEESYLYYEDEEDEEETLETCYIVDNSAALLSLEENAYLEAQH